MCLAQGAQRSEAGEPRTNKLGRGPLGDVKYQISRVYAFWY